MSNQLTLKQEKFVQEYLTNGGNASAAYRATYSITKMGDNAINVEASKLLKNPKIALRLKQYQEETKEKTQITREFLNGKYLTLLDYAMSCIDGGTKTLRDAREARRVASDLAKLNGLVVPQGENEDDASYRKEMPSITVNYEDKRQQVVFNVGEPLNGDAVESTPDAEHTTKAITTDYKV